MKKRKISLPFPGICRVGRKSCRCCPENVKVQYFMWLKVITRVQGYNINYNIRLYQIFLKKDILRQKHGYYVLTYKYFLRNLSLSLPWCVQASVLQECTMIICWKWRSNPIYILDPFACKIVGQDLMGEYKYELVDNSVSKPWTKKWGKWFELKCWSARSPNFLASSFLVQ